MTAPADRHNAATISFQGVSFEVYHLTLADLATLKRHHVVQFLETLDAFKEMLLHKEPFQRAYGVLSVALEMHAASAHIIELASRGACDRVEAERLPIGIQLQALVDIAARSVADHEIGGVGSKIVDLLKGAIPLAPEEIN